MRKIIPALCLLLSLSLLSAARATETAQLSPDFSVPVNLSASPRTIAAFEGGDFLIAGSGGFASEQSAFPLMLRVTPAGGEVWRLALETNPFCGIHSAALLPDGRIAAIRYAQGSDDVDYALLWIADGVVQREQPFPYTGNRTSPDVYPVDSAVLVTHTVGQNQDARGGQFYVRAVELLDANGDSRWRRDFTDYEIAPEGAIPLSDGGYALFGVVEEQQSGHRRWHGFVAKLTAGGELAWFYETPAQGRKILSSVIELDGGDLVAVGSEFGPNEPDDFQHAIAVRLSPQGEELWLRAYEEPGKKYSAAGGLLAVDGNILCSVMALDYPLEHLLLTLDGAGDVVRTASLPSQERVVSGYLRLMLWNGQACAVRMGEAGYAGNENTLEVYLLP